MTWSVKTISQMAAAASLTLATALPVSFAVLALAGTPVASQAQSVVRGLPDFTELVEQVGPSVVNIRTLEKAKSNPAAGPGSDEEMQEFFKRFFGVPIPNVPRQAPRPNGRAPQSEEPAQPRGMGSGFVLSSDGYIMTNAHVVEGADEVIVTLTDKREFKARIIGADKRTDVAVVKIQATGLPVVKVGDVSRLKVGEWVMAIGSPFGLENSVTAGIVSAKQRDTGEYLSFIQTDVAINPGNSGGPLINMRGEVVGINSQIYSRSGGYMGISFAIPMDEAIRVSEQLRQSGRVTRGRIGVQIGEVSKEVAESLGLGASQGALVRGIEAGSPADKAGLEPGDIITRFDGKAIDKAADLPRMVGGTKPGTRSNLTVFRRGANKDLAITVAELEPAKTSKPAAPAEESKTAGTAQSMGLVVTDLTEAQKKEFKRGGVRVESTAEASARAGLREGDVILQIGNTEIAQLRDFETAMAKLDKSKPFNILFRRGEVVQFAVVRPGR